MLLVKLGVSMAMVIAITFVAERVSSRFAGVLLGFPLGVGVSLFFIGYEHGASFAAQSSLWTSQGLLPSLIWCLCYLLCANLFRALSRSLAVILSFLLSLCCYLPTAFVVQRFGPPSFFIRLIIALLGLVFFALLFRRFSPQKSVIIPLPFSWAVLLGRALFTGLIIVAITSSAAHVGNRWSGIFSAFPSTILPVALILHTHYGPEILYSLFRELPMGMLAIVVFSLTVFWSYPTLGVFCGTLCSYTVATLYLLIYEGGLRTRLEKYLTALPSEVQNYNH